MVPLWKLGKDALPPDKSRPSVRERHGPRPAPHTLSWVPLIKAQGQWGLVVAKVRGPPTAHLSHTIVGLPYSPAPMLTGPHYTFRCLVWNVFKSSWKLVWNLPLRYLFYLSAIQSSPTHQEIRTEQNRLYRVPLLWELSIQQERSLSMRLGEMRERLKPKKNKYERRRKPFPHCNAEVAARQRRKSLTQAGGGGRRIGKDAWSRGEVLSQDGEMRKCRKC